MQLVNELEIKNINKLCKVMAKVVKKRRKALHKSIYAISAEVTIAKNTWRLIEKGEVKYPSFVTVCKISEALDMKPYELIKEIYDELGENFSLSGLN